MIFEILYESSKRGELLLINGGFCHWHWRQNGQLTIREIISTHPGAGNEMLTYLKQVPGTISIFAKCPVELEANIWYAKRGFIQEAQEITRTGRLLNHWRLYLD